MKVLKYILLVLLIIYFLVSLIVAFRSKKGIRFLLLNLVISLAAFFALYFLKGKIGLFLPLNYYTFFTAAAFGLPGILAILLLNLIM